MDSTDPHAVHVVQEGVIIPEDGTFKDAERTQNVVDIHHIDEERDAEVGVEISKFNLNYTFQPPDLRDYKLRSVLKEAIDPQSLPKKVDLRGEWGDIMDQGSLGSCVANTVSGCIRFVRRKLNMTVYDPSRLYIYYYGRKIEDFPVEEDTGMYIRSGYKSVAKYSVCAERNWPYKEDIFDQEPSEYAQSAARTHRVFDYYNLDPDPLELKKCLADGYPISFGAAVFESFMSATTARTGVVPVPKPRERSLGGHAMTIVGYDEEKQHYLVANSWSANWGDKGFCYFPYEYMHNGIMCGDYWSPRRFGK